ncbi:dynein regulation protein LC7 [Streptomyces sulfonofaciens]|uniref:Dynein regulation protein LC7 n=1 Tax=Streptomyces sulfonofaciens TaxID=68272 RepID=A0A919GKS9_9ACTN|nr:roadblock/LC7 domain-containing protein [Streptomyces sulfonofaciens]GHH86241.1 dynein regulation protein LC7 [Streptomyces sulfonofaciens]
MPSDAPTGRTRALDRLMADLVQRVPHTRSAVLLSSDGLVKAAHGIDTDRADHLAAVACGLYWLGRGAGTRLCGGDTVRQVVVELDSTLLFVSTADPGACLAVLAGQAADPTALGYEMTTVATAVRPHLAAPPRPAAARPAAVRP